MPSGPRAGPCLLLAAAAGNRALLEQVMKKHGFAGLPTEWWHFDAQGWERFPVEDIPLDAIP